MKIIRKIFREILGFTKYLSEDIEKNGNIRYAKQKYGDSFDYESRFKKY